jgi:hypothetical protein
MLAVALAFLTTLVVTGRRGASAVLRPLLLAALAALPLVALFAGPPGDTAQPGALGHPLKEESLRIRLRVWQGTGALILDRPLGAGSGNFLHAFLPYQLRDERLRSEEVVYSSPHSEILRALAEEGLAWCALAAYLFWRLCTAVWRRARVDGWTPAEVVVAAGAAFLAVESAFQFPFAMALGSLAAAVLLGLALTLADADAPAAEHARRRTATRFALLAAAAVASAALARLVVSDHLADARPHAVRAQRRACDLDPRNLRACLRAAWLDARAGNRPQARGRLAAVLDRSPYYYPAVKLLADESLAQGDATAGCFHLWVYDALFAGRSAEHARLARLCDLAWLETYRLAVPVPGYERFPILVPAGSPD